MGQIIIPMARNNLNRTDRLYNFLSIFSISSKYIVSFSSYILCVSSRTSSNDFCATGNEYIFIIRDNISDAVPMIAKAGTCRESQGMLIINAPKKATIRIRKKF